MPAHHLSYEVQEHPPGEFVCLVRGVGLFIGHMTAGNLALGGEGALIGAGILLGFPSFMLLSLEWGSRHNRPHYHYFFCNLKDKESLLTTYRPPHTA